MVVSTLCRKCGDHLRIENKRVIGSGERTDYAADTVEQTALAADNEPGRDALTPAAPSPESKVKKTVDHAIESKASPSNKHPSIIPGPVISGAAEKKDNSPAQAGKTDKLAAQASETDDSGFGAMIQRSVADKGKVPVAAKDKAPRPHSHMPAPTPSPPPASASTLQKMKDQGFYRQQYFKDAQCFDCGHSFKVGRSARSANCPQCGSWISMEDVEINMNSTHPVKTRGDVMIRKRGHLSTSSVQCKDFECHGLLEANVNATGDASFRTNGTVIGEVRCHRLVIEKGADVTFSNPVYADQVEIHAKITATVFSRGPVLITAYGAVNGDVTARSVSIEPGGELNGAMNIIRGEAVLFHPAAKL
jgi:cytoskeletal protein CcmA (bactofilin family)/ribosomal protein S27E